MIIGEGGSGGAIAIAAANSVIMLEHSIYSVISPEGAASILWRDAGRAQDAATSMKITARTLSRFGIIDTVVAEPPGGAHRDPDVAILAGRRRDRTRARWFRRVVAAGHPQCPGGKIPGDRTQVAAPPVCA